jgi:hypothetical protein
VASQCFQTKGFPLFRCHGQYLYRLYPQAQKLRLKPRFLSEEVLKIFGLKSSAGRSVSWIENHLLDLSNELIQKSETYFGALSILHQLAGASYPTLQSPYIKGEYLLEPYFQALLERFERSGCCDLQRGHLYFTNDDHRYYMQGGWIFIQFYNSLVQLKDEITLWDLKMGVHLEWMNQKTNQSHTLQVDLIALIEHEFYFFFYCYDQPDLIHKTLDLIRELQVHLPVRCCFLIHQPLTIELERRFSDLDLMYCSAQDWSRSKSWLKNQLLDASSFRSSL